MSYAQKIQVLNATLLALASLLQALSQNRSLAMLYASLCLLHVALLGVV